MQNKIFLCANCLTCFANHKLHHEIMSILVLLLCDKCHDVFCNCQMLGRNKLFFEKLLEKIDSPSAVYPSLN